MFSSTLPIPAIAKAVLLALALASADLALGACWAVPIDIAPDHAGVITGCMNTLGNLGGLVGPLVVGIAVDRWHSWTFPFYITALVYAGGALAWLAIDPTRNRRVGEFVTMVHELESKRLRSPIHDRGSIAIARSGAPVPPLIFIGRATTNAPRGGKAIEVGQILERRDVALVQDPVRLVERRLPVVDARGVEPTALTRRVSGEPARGVLVQAGKVQLRDRVCAALGVPRYRDASGQNFE